MKFLTRPLFLAALALFFSVAPHSYSQTQADVRPPFGFFWGDAKEGVMETLKGVKATVSEPRVVAEREAYDVTGLIRPGMKKAIFYFKKDALVEIELVYQNDEWNATQYETLLKTSAQRFTRSLGMAKEVNENTKPDEETTQVIRGYEWTGFDTQLVLMFYSATRELNTFRSLSLSYRYNFAADLDQPMDTGLLPDGTSPLPENASPADEMPPAGVNDPLPVGGATPAPSATPTPEATPAPDATATPAESATPAPAASPESAATPALPATESSPAPTATPAEVAAPQ